MENDEVILPSFAYPTCASAIIKAGGTPVFSDINPQTLNLDPRFLERSITSKTKAVMPIWYAGVPEPEPILDICKKHGLKLIEDAAQAIGNFELSGDFGAISFHFTKNVSVGEGGVLLCKPGYVKKAKTLCACGTNRWNDRKNWNWIEAFGSSFIMSEMLTQPLWQRLQATDFVNRQKREIWQIYSENIKAPWKSTKPGNGHIFWFCSEKQKELLEIPGLVKHYEALHLSTPGRRYGRNYDACNVSTTVTEQIVRPPMNVTYQEARDIAKTINSILG
jgi:dTDP-4-amino-4,6-dideoxygalactose transaminase